MSTNDKISNGMNDSEILAISYKEPAKFAQLFDRHNGRFLAMARKRVKSQDEAEDIVQNTFIRIYKHGRKFLEKGGNFKFWSNAILRNCAIDQLKSRRAKEIPLTEEIESALGDSREFELKESANFIESILKKLDATTAKILELRFVLGKSFKEIGKILGITSGAARVRAFRAKKAFVEIHNQLNTTYEQ